MNMIQRTIARRIATKALGTQLGVARVLDLKLGMALLRDSRVPARHKASAVGFGVAMATGLVALEVPIEGILAMALPVLGGALDMVTDGAEEMVGTMLVAALVLPFIAPAEVVELIRAERAT